MVGDFAFSVSTSAGREVTLGVSDVTEGLSRSRLQGRALNSQTVAPASSTTHRIQPRVVVATPTYFSDILTMEGNSGSGTYVLGDIVVDNLTLGGTSGITMDLNPAQAAGILKATLLR